MRKEYEKPALEEFEFKFEEMLAKPSGHHNCHAERGKKKCEPAKLWSHGNPGTP